MSCRPPCGARRCRRRRIATTPPSCLAGKGSLAKYYAALACTGLTEGGVGHEASIHNLQSANAYLRVGIGPLAPIWTGCICLVRPRWYIISHEMQSTYRFSFVYLLLVC